MALKAYLGLPGSASASAIFCLTATTAVVCLVLLNIEDLMAGLSRTSAANGGSQIGDITATPNTPFVKETKVLATWTAYENNTIDVLRAKELSWDRAIQQAKHDLAEKQGNAECLLPNIEGTMELLEQYTNGQHPPTPILNVGFPKCGSSSLFDYFVCTGYTATHWLINIDHFEGVCMRDAVATGVPPLQFCSPGIEAILQMDVEYPLQNRKVANDAMSFRDECFFPQMSILEEIHKESPHATFILNFRPIDDWIRSISSWKHNMMSRLQLCNLPNLPRGTPQNLTDMVQLRETMLEFWCSHITHVRNFVKDHPSHQLIELDLYDTVNSAYVMSKLFPKRPNAPPPKKHGKDHSALSCWGQSNANPNN